MYSNFSGAFCIVLYMYFLKCFWTYISYVLYFYGGLHMYCMTANTYCTTFLLYFYGGLHMYCTLFLVSCYVLYLCLHITIVWLLYLMFGDNLIFWSILCCFITIVKTGLKMASSSSKRKNRPVGPISIDGDGRLYDLHYDALVERIGRHVCHADEFPPALIWPDHKNSGRVEKLYGDMAVSYFNI